MGIPVDYLLPYLRLRIGDTNPDAYRYEDKWLVTGLTLGVKLAARYWNSKYLITDKGYVTRNPNAPFITDESIGVIEDRDEPIIVILGAISVLGGSLENSAWDFTSWKDSEISVSSQGVSNTRLETIRRLIAELDTLITAPNKRLAQALKNSLVGFKDNIFENTTKL
jgi:hypothetical protein